MQWDVPRSAKLATFAPYRNSSNEKHAGVSGKIRRELTPFLWHSLMGISRTVCPDEDPMVQVTLLIDSLQRKLFGINQPPSAAVRSMKNLQELQDLCFQVGKDVSTVLGQTVNTKTHRLMRHVVDHVISFGCIRKGATDDNESLHKTTKKAYSSTNQHLIQIAPQLLSARAEMRSSADNCSDIGLAEKQLLLTRDAAFREQAENDNVELSSFTSRRELPASHVEPAREMEKLVSLVSADHDLNDLERIILEQKHPSSLISIWSNVKSVRFFARLPWMRDHKFRQTIYAGENIYGSRSRYDAIMYKLDDRCEYGIVRAIFTHAGYPKSKVLLVMRLKEVEAERGNLKVTKVFGNRRFAHVLSARDVELDVLQSDALIRTVMLIPDPYVVSRIYGRKHRMNDIPDDRNARKVMRYFEVAGFKFTSLPEHTL